jgi:hypothetical protein
MIDSYYTSQNIPCREALMEEMYALGVRFTKEQNFLIGNNLITLIHVASRCPNTDTSK